jgi:hypothetical protein
MAYLEKTTSGMSDGNKKIWTLSFWMKRAKLGTEQFLWSWGENNSNDGKILFGAGDQLVFMNDGQCGSNQTMTRALKDTSGWYHIVWRCKADESSNDDRWKLYINGELIPASEYGSPSISNADGIVNKWSTQDCWHCGNARSQQSGSVNPFYGLMSHIHFCDGYAYDASDFGETDATTGEWKIKTEPSVSYGTNGYFILKNGNSGTDQSPNSNNFTAVGTITKTEDNPSNNFCTMNPHDCDSSMNLSYGNLRTASPSNNWMPIRGTIGMYGQNGKFYWEGKCESGTNHYFGVYDIAESQGNSQSSMDAHRFVYVYNGGMERTITGQSAIASGTYATFGNGDIIGVGLDKENGTITFWKDGVQIYTETHSSLQTKNLIPGTQAYGSDIQWNFGNGYFNATAVASAGTNASNLGIFEYDVPSGYTALCTKGLNT